LQRSKTGAKDGQDREERGNVMTATRLSVLVGAFSLAAACLSAQRCLGQTVACSPNQFESDVSVGTFPPALPLTWTPNATWSYDYTNRRQFFSAIDASGRSTSVIMDFERGLRYEWKTSAQGNDLSCRVDPLPGSMVQLCGSVEDLGFSLGGSLPVETWTGTFPAWQLLGGALGRDAEGDLTVEGLSSKVGFLPISMTTTGTAHPTGARPSRVSPSSWALFLNETAGIRNPGVFRPPDSCP
jgi:hypothetical protein